MKILFTSDLHLNMSDYGVMDKEVPHVPFRTMDALRAFEFIVDKAINEIKPSLFIVNGDIYDNARPSVFVNSFFYKQLNRLGDNNIGVILLLGNHDVGKNFHPLEPLQSLNLKKVKIIDEPKILSIKDLNLMCFPFSRDIANRSISIKEKFNLFLEECDDKLSNDSSLNIFCGHFPVNGAVMSKHNVKSLKDVSLGKSKLINNNSNDISLKDIHRINADYVFLGDYHQSQKLKIHKQAYYSGSIERTDISELEEQKGFYILDTDSKDLVFEEITCLRDMINLKGTYDNMLKQISKARYNPEKFKNPIIKLSFVGNSAEYFVFQNNLGDLKNKLISSYAPIHLFDTKKILKSEQYTEEEEIFDDISVPGINESFFHESLEDSPHVDKSLLQSVATEILNGLNETEDVTKKASFYMNKYFEEINI